MKTINMYFLIGFLALLLLALVPQGWTAGMMDEAIGRGAVPVGDRIPGHYIVVLKDDTGDPGGIADDMALEHGIGIGHIYEFALKGFAAVIPDDRLPVIEMDGRVLFVSEDKTVAMAAETLPTGVDRMNAEPGATVTGNKGTGINVAVIDTGIDLKHPDLKPNIVGGKNCSTGRSYGDGNGHGTHVAGAIAALDNDIGVIGAAPEAKLWAVRVLNNSGSGTWSSVICGIDFVTSKAPGFGGPIVVANMSLGGSGASDDSCGLLNNDAMHKALCRSKDAGVVYVVAAGNDGADSGGFVPAAYDDTVITVSALADSDGMPGGMGAAMGYGADDTFASFSNYGALVDLGAPGVSILSTYKGGGYATLSGTSMASPHVAGAAALYLKLYPGSTWLQVRDGLKGIGEYAGSGHDDPSGMHPEPVVRADLL